MTVWALPVTQEKILCVPPLQKERFFKNPAWFKVYTIKTPP